MLYVRVSSSRKELPNQAIHRASAHQSLLRKSGPDKRREGREGGSRGVAHLGSVDVLVEEVVWGRSFL